MKEPESYRIYLHKSNNPAALLHEAFEIIDGITRKNPFEKKTVVIQSEAQGRWFALKAAERGIAANMEFLSPGDFLRGFAEKHLGIRTKNSVFSKKNTEWALYSLFKSGFTEKPELAPVRNYIKSDERRCFGLCRRIAGLFEQYAVYRPHIIAAWQKGKLCSDSPDEIWQKEIFTELKKLYPSSDPDFAKIFIEKCQSAHYKGDPEKPLILFGISQMSRYHLNMFRSLSALFPVHVFAVLPSREYVCSAEKDTFFRKFCAESMEITDFFVENPPFQETGIFVEPLSETLLSSIQRDILSDAANPEKALFDDSVRISACCGKMREIEVLKDSLLELFKNDETLSPEDIAVLCPDLKSYEPCINAVFGNTADDRTFIPHVLAEGNAAEEAKTAETFLKIIRLAGGNYEKSEVLSIFREPFVCGNFGVSREDFPEIEKLLDESGVRHGLGGGRNTWEFGLDRIMMSRLMPFSEEGSGFKDILPLENFREDKTASMEGFITFVKGLFRFSEAVHAEKTPSDFKYILEKAVDFFFQDDAAPSGETRRLKEILGEFAERAGKYADKVSFDAVRTYLEGELSKTVFHRNSVGSRLNFSSLKQMRTIPFRVVCLIGMDEESFPGKDAEYAFDLTRRVSAENGEPRIRPQRENDSFLFLEAVLSAGEKLIISYDGKEPREDSKKHRAAAMPVRILEKYIAEKTGTDPDKIEIKYPVSPFSADYFTENGTFRTFSRSAFRVAEKMFHREKTPRPTFTTAVTEEKGKIPEHIYLPLDDLLSFFKDPQKFYFTKTLKLLLPETGQKNGDEEIFDYDDNLQNALLRKTYLKMSAGLPDEETVEMNFIRRMKGEGKIPDGILGEEKLKTVIKSGCIRELAEKLYSEESSHRDFSVELDETGVTLYGRIGNIRQEHAVLAEASQWNNAKYKQIHSLIRHFAMNASGTRLDTVTYALNADREVCGYTLEKTDERTATENLSVFVRLWRNALLEMPLYNGKIIAEADKTDDLNAEIEKEKKNRFVSPYFLLMADQPDRKEKCLKAELNDIKKAANLMKLFKNERKSNKQ